MHTLPIDPELFKKWVEVLQRQDIPISKRIFSRVCDIRFSSEVKFIQNQNRKTLKHISNPSTSQANDVESLVKDDVNVESDENQATKLKMACATLKRSLDWEPVLGGRPAKRRRCIPFCASPTQKDRGFPTTSGHNSPSGSSSPKTSVFPDVLSKKLTPEYMAENIKAELKRLQRRKQLQYSMMENSDGGSSGGENSESPSRSEKPLFTFKQVGLICERMLRERESEIREEYDNVLTAKLAEQYDAFVKFTYDQIHKNYSSSAAPSYLS